MGMELEILERAKQLAGFGIVRQSITLSLCLVMAIGYRIYVHNSSKRHPNGVENPNNDKFSMIEHQRSVMKVICPMVVTEHVYRFLWLVLPPSSVFVLLASVLIVSVANIIATIYVKVEFILLIIASYQQITKSPSSKTTMKSTIKRIRWFYLAYHFLLPLFLGLLGSLTKSSISKWFLLAEAIEMIEVVAIDSFLILIAVLYLKSQESVSSLDAQEEHESRVIGVQSLIIAAIRLNYTIYFLITGTDRNLFFIGRTFYGDLLQFDTILMPMSVIIAYLATMKTVNNVEPMASIQNIA